jgi:methylenetetrahydrofolate dehydrogenase (NADP+)/methenyltetrahydrofolate cyclohydrolase
MNARIIDGNALAQSVRNEVALRVRRLADRGIQTGLAVILVGDNPASAVYVRNKVKDCEEVGIVSTLDRMPSDTSEATLLARIAALNANPNVHGILVQLPLPVHIDEHRVIEAIASAKDADGFHVSNVGLLMTGKPLFRPCTPYGVMKMLEHAGTPLEGAHAVVIGRSNIVGKPQALMLLAAGATVTICHSRTQATVIDVGMNRGADGKLCGDVDYAGVSQVAGAITPVPGGVGPMTRAMLLVNTVEAAERSVA